MGRDVSYQEALNDLEADIGRRVMSGDDEGLSDEALAKRWAQYRKGKDMVYYPSRTMELLHREERLVRGVMGPVGNGKTTGMAADMNMRHFRQLACGDGVVRDRFAMVRGSLVLLKSTLVDTWMAMFPQTVMCSSRSGVFGTLKQTRAGVRYELELRGFGLDKVGALGNLLSNNFSGAMINEGTTISEKAKDGVVGRCGRYPDLRMAPPNFKSLPGAWKDKDGYWRYFKNHGVDMDTNAASEDSWWYKKSRDGGANPEREVYFESPPAAFKVWDEEKERWKYELNMGQRPGVPPAENIEHLPEHWDYYRNIIDSSAPEHIDRYVCCIYSKTEVGTPIFGSTFSEHWHVARGGVPWPPQGTRIFGGMDFGSLRRVVLAYLSAEGRLMVFAEAIDTTGSVETFANNVLRPMLASHGFSVADLTLFCDPAGVNPGEHSDMGAISIMRACGFDAQPPARLPNNDVGIRLEAVRHFLTQLIGTKGAVQIDPGCTVLLRSIGGGYVWGRRKVGAEYMDCDEPAKNGHSHIADAFQYLCCGIRYGGDIAKVIGMALGGRQLRNFYVPLWESAGAIGDDGLC